MLNLLDYTIIFLSTEGFRLAGLGNNRDSGNRQKTLMWLTLPLAALWSSMIGWVCLTMLPSPPQELGSQYHQAVIIVAMTGVGQMLAEPPMVVGQVLKFVRLRVVMIDEQCARAGVFYPRDFNLRCSPMALNVEDTN